MKNSDRFWQRLIDSVGGIDSSRRLAAGVTMGMLIGLIPKESLLPFLFGVLLILSPANLLTGFVSALLFSLLAKISVIATFFDQLGILILRREWSIDGIGALYQYPLFAWLRMENSIVAGATLFGLLIVVPVYLLSEKWFDSQGIRLIKRLFQMEFFRGALGLRKRSIEANQSESPA